VNHGFGRLGLVNGQLSGFWTDPTFTNGCKQSKIGAFVGRGVGHPSAHNGWSSLEIDLFVDDSKFMRMANEGTLPERNTRLVSASHGEEALLIEAH
jgi:hypothetical protein